MKIIDVFVVNRFVSIISVLAILALIVMKFGFKYNISNTSLIVCILLATVSSVLGFIRIN